jgi:hypothetical protein
VFTILIQKYYCFALKKALSSHDIAMVARDYAADGKAQWRDVSTKPIL